jgi:predicted tellurium resistance membrane protein TerC
MELLLDVSTWASLATLTVLEVILGVDNIIVLALLTQSLPKRDARRARSAGLGLALGLRLLLLSAISWITRLTFPVFSLAGQVFSWRDLILIGGGLFLMLKATQEIHTEIEGDDADRFPGSRGKARFRAVIAQIAVMDLIFSLDSIVTAVGLARDIEVMAAAISIAIGIMYFAAEPVGGFVERHPTIKMLALCFLILIGVALIADGFGLHIPRAYIYFAMGFAGIVEAFNIWAKRTRGRQAAGHPETGRAKTPAELPSLSGPRGVSAQARRNRAERKKTRKK